MSLQKNGMALLSDSVASALQIVAIYHLLFNIEFPFHRLNIRTNLFQNADVKRENLESDDHLMKYNTVFLSVVCFFRLEQGLFAFQRL